uniref:Uncharacterized protein n=1 Tax=Anguilla anguilla TaxID=7936 RepID=A0A0E9XH92_ANGAN
MALIFKMRNPPPPPKKTQ